VTASAPAPAPAAAPPAATESPAADEGVQYVTSPMVGTFYSAPNPEAAAFVQVGDRVGPDSTVCMVEAMKVFNEIHAECSGTVAAVLVENGEPIEFGQKLFKIVSEA
jgi:acetyl-CoA carboxylase biotin carboxyl carrier protein